MPKKTSEIIYRYGIEGRIKLRDESVHRSIFSRNLSGKFDAITSADVVLSRYDLVCLPMQQPQYTDHTIRVLTIKIAEAKLPCLSIMNMPPLPYLKQIPALAAMHHLEEAYTNAKFENGSSQDWYRCARPIRTHSACRVRQRLAFMSACRPTSSCDICR